MEDSSTSFCRIPIANYLYRNGRFHEALVEYKKIALDMPALARPLGLCIREAACKLASERGYEPQRAAIFAGYSSSGVVEDYVIHYLKELRKHCNRIIYVCDNDLKQSELAKLSWIADVVISGRHGEYDFGSYKRGLGYLSDQGYLSTLDWIIICNDSCYGPVTGFNGIFEKMERQNVDFWGISSNEWPEPHIQSYFVSFSFPVFSNESFRKFFASIEKKNDVSEVVLSYETKLTSLLAAQGFGWACATNIKTFYSKISHFIDKNPTLNPLLMLEAGSELLKVKSVSKAPQCNRDGVFPLLQYLHNKNPLIVANIAAHCKNAGLLEMEEPSFSVILPSKNRANFLANALDSVFDQDYKGSYEVILVDDGSTDGTEQMVFQMYQSHLEAGRLKYVRLERSLGVANARNAGLKMASCNWIAYLDSDNQMAPGFFGIYSSAIACNPGVMSFYAQFQNIVSRTVGGKVFDSTKLRRGNFIDIGTFVHRRLETQDRPLHDHRLKRLVDWEFILSMSAISRPVYIPMVTLLYSDADHERISNTEGYEESLRYIYQKHSIPAKVTTIILAFNHEEYLAECLKSVCEQRGDFEHEIIFADDCSSDNTWQTFLSENKKYNRRCIGIRRPRNLGQAKNLIDALTKASGDYIAIIEADDYWTDKQKLNNQVSFLNENLDCSMVFSKISVLSSETGEIRFLSRQERLQKSKLTGQDFLDHKSMNLIANFSSCMYRASVIRELPSQHIHNRLNEISVAFFCESKGLIGYIPIPMSVYRQHPRGLWSGATSKSQLTMAIQARQQVKALSDEQWHSQIDREIQRLQAQLAASSNQCS